MLDFQFLSVRKIRKSATTKQILKSLTFEITSANKLGPELGHYHWLRIFSANFWALPSIAEIKFKHSKIIVIIILTH